MQKRGLRAKEKREITIVIGSVLLVVIVGILLSVLAPPKLSGNLAGKAVYFDMSKPSYEGTLLLLKNYCAPVIGTGSCNSICGNERSCLPVEENCDLVADANTCVCCGVPQ